MAADSSQLTTPAPQTRSAAVVAADAPVAIVSAFGRGNWLALELAKKGFRVTLVDVTASLGDIEPEDAEGPFGLFEPSDLSPLQKSRLEKEGELVSSSGGFTFWLADGPLEMSGPMASLRLKNLGLSDQAIHYVSRVQAPDRDSERELRLIARAPFRESWVAHLSHQLFSRKHEENHRALEIGYGAPLTARFSIRQATREGWKKGVAALKAAGVTVREGAAVRDLRLNGRDVDALEIDDDHAGIERARAFIWLISSHESKLLPKQMFERLFPGGAAEPEWYWHRHIVKLGGARSIDALPAAAVLIDDVFLPWSQLNTLVMRRRKEARSFDVWQKLPVSVRADAARLAELSAEVEARLARRMPAYAPKVQSSEKLSEVISQPVYREDVVDDLDMLRAGNFFFCGPERCESLDWLGTYRAQSVVLGKLEKLKSQWDQAARKLAAKEATP